MSDHQNTRMISVDQLRPGIYVYLDMSWIDHGFSRNSFKIKDQKQIDAIRRLGLKTIRVNPRLCDGPPLPLPAPGSEVAVPEAQPPEDKASVLRKQAILTRLSEQQAALAQCERQFTKFVTTLKNLSKNIYARPAEALADAGGLVDEMLETLLTDTDIATHLMSDRVGGEDMYLHSLNVTVLAMMLGRKLDLTPEELRALGIGCLFHDIGKADLAQNISGKLEPLSRLEKNAMQLHCEYGTRHVMKTKMPIEALEIILQHHEAYDGSGYPAKKKGEEISKLARIAAVVNTYDNLCNHINPSYSVTPFEALSSMFKTMRATFDPAPFNMFIRCMGIYPPGTLVKLSDGTYGMVVGVNSNAPMRPNVLIYDPGVLKSEAILVDLEKETSLTVAASITAQQLPPAAYDYLSPKKRQVYFSYATNSKTAS